MAIDIKNVIKSVHACMQLMLIGGSVAVNVIVMIIMMTMCIYSSGGDNYSHDNNVSCTIDSACFIAEVCSKN